MTGRKTAANMAKNKTTQTAVSVTDFINRVADQTKREDSFRIVELMKRLSGFEPVMWGPAIIGFGSYHYKYESGHEGDAPLMGFSPRKDALVIYLATNFKSREALLQQLGPHKIGVSCLYIKKLANIDMKVLEMLNRDSFDHMKKRYCSTNNK